MTTTSILLRLAIILFLTTSAIASSAQIILDARYNLPEGNIISIAEDSNEIVWVATPHEIRFMNGIFFQSIKGLDQRVSQIKSRISSIAFSATNDLNIRLENDSILTMKTAPMSFAVYKSKTVVAGGLKKGKLPSDSILFLDSNQQQWMGSGAELMVIPSDYSALSMPKVYQTWINNEPALRTAPSELTQQVSLPYNKNSINIAFASPNHFIYENLAYAYILQGIDSSWTHSGDQRRAGYANLGPGTYSFKLKAKTSQGEWIVNENALLIQVTPPFWSEWWFHLLTVVFVLILFSLIYKVRVSAAIQRVLSVQNIRKEESESLRVMMAKDFHDEMGNKLASIIVLVNTLEFLINEKSIEILKALNKIEDASKSLFSGTKSFIWSINPQSDHFNEIITYIIHFGTDLFDQTNIRFDVLSKNDDPMEKLILPVGHSRQIFFIFKEAMTNTLVHANASKATFDFTYIHTKETYSLTFSDNGIGLRDKNQNSPRGLGNMKSRAGKISCRLSIMNNQSGGLNVTLIGQKLIK